MGTHRPRNVLDLVFAHILERKIELIAHLIMHDAADPDAAWLRQGFETRRDVDAVTIDVLVINDDIAHVQTNPKLNTPFWRNLNIALGHLPLNIDCTAYGVDDTGKLNKDTVARRLDNAPAVFRDLGIDDRASVTLERGQCAFFIKTHQPRIACDISRKNGREAALDPLSTQGVSPKSTSTNCASCGWPLAAVGLGVQKTQRGATAIERTCLIFSDLKEDALSEANSRTLRR
jgi:hypothetical protein